jgi:hypothetical protein
MRDRDGNLVHGKRLRYAVDDGKVEVMGKDETKPPAPATPAAAPASPGGSAVARSPAAAGVQGSGGSGGSRR